ncbi:MAG: transcriptional regulator [Erysipelotrichaceae bacterium]|nr:transcriptional regulator [Erysipelotrichaceae bacterium]MDD3809173.1 transcriptional regulator [Erysipelotrichaceae bacterium]
MEIEDIPQALTLPLRLIIISILIGAAKNFNDLKILSNSSDGNLSVQLKKLETWGYVSSSKIKQQNRTVTYYNLTKYGQEQFENYVKLLSRIIGNVDDF